jgi:hypothetical protein
MFVGHLGVGLALSSRSRAFRLGTLLGGVMLLDVLLGLFVLAGWEQVIVPPDSASGHYLEFVFPYSHGLVASLLWSGLAAALASTGVLLLGRGAAGAWVAAAAVGSHFVCDVVEHVRGLPLLGEGSPHLGLGLWRAMGWALGLELLLLVAGMGLFLRSRPGSARAPLGAADGARNARGPPDVQPARRGPAAARPGPGGELDRPDGGAGAARARADPATVRSPAALGAAADRHRFGRAGRGGGWPEPGTP